MWEDGSFAEKRNVCRVDENAWPSRNSCRANRLKSLDGGGGKKEDRRRRRDGGGNLWRKRVGADSSSSREDAC